MININTKVAQELSKPKESKFLGVGLHDNVQLISVKTEISTNGNRFIELVFSKDGKTFNHTEWEPTRSQYDVDDSNLQNKINSQVTRYDNILKCFYPNEEDRTFTGTEYAQYLSWLVNKLETANKSILLRIKLIFNDKGYIAFPKYLKFPFVERMDTEESKIAILSIDQMTKPVVADQEQKNTNPFSLVNSTPASGLDALPY